MIKKYGKVIIYETGIRVTEFEFDGGSPLTEALQDAKQRIEKALVSEEDHG